MKGDKAFDARVVKRHEVPNENGESDTANGLSSPEPSKSKPITGSPSSDKENKSKQALITDMFKTKSGA